MHSSAVSVGILLWISLGLLSSALAQTTAPIPLTSVAALYPHNASGEALVTVIVTVSPTGAVVEVSPSSGPEEFLQAAVHAAEKMEFSPGLEDGVPVLSSIPVTFHFAPPEAHPHEEEIAIEVVVNARAAGSEDSHATTTLNQDDLSRSAGQDLATSITKISGVTQSQGTAATSKPIIRGQTERRLLVLTDGVPLASQKWGADHATEIDPFAAGQIRVIKGAAGVRYGPDAIGGVVLVDPPPLRDQGVGGKVQLIGVSNGQRGVGAARVDVAPTDNLSVRIEGNYGRGAALSTPTYVLGNTGSEQWNLGGRARYKLGKSTFTLAAQHYDLEAGICYCVKTGTREDFLGQLTATKPTSADSWRTSYKIDRPHQTVTHDLVFLRANTVLPAGTLEATYAFQINHRQEFSAARASIQGAQFDFTLRTHSLNLHYQHPSTQIDAHTKLTGQLGLSGSFQENVYTGLPLIPNHRSLSTGVYGYERLSTNTVDVEVGARYDHQSRTSFLTSSAFARHQNRGTLTEDDCEHTDDVARCGRTFNTGSVSAGALWHALQNRLELKLDLSSASRFPNSDELYMNGSAPTSPVFALGDPSLGVETTWGASPTVGLRLPWLTAEASTYINAIQNYIQFAPELSQDGQPAFDVTIRGASPRFGFHPINALYYGVDGGFTLGTELPLSLRATGSVVRAINRTTSAPLSFIPPDRAQLSLRAQPDGLGPFSENFLEISGQVVDKQRHPGPDLAPPPDGYLLLSAAAGVEVLLRHERTLQVGLEATNILNQSYRNYTSLLRYFSTEPGRSLRARVSLEF